MPTPTTLRKYGLSLEQWQEIYDAQGKKCAICEAPFESEDGEQLRNSYIDHAHVRGYKKMKPEDKRKYVRGILCFICNRIAVQKSNTIERLEAAAQYLRKFKEQLQQTSDT